jgi:hypothetical protein
VIIKNQNVLHSPGLSRICRWQLRRLLNDEKFLRPRAKLTIKRKKAKRIGRTIFSRQSQERGVEYSGPVMGAPLFHTLRYRRPSHHGHGASVRSSRATCENIFTTSFEIDRSSPTRWTRRSRRAIFLRRISFGARRQLQRKPVVAALTPAAELKLPSPPRSREALRYKSRSFLACAR